MEEEINLVDYIKVILKFKVFIIISIILSSLGGIGYYFYTPKVYMSKATLLPSSKQNSAANIMGNLGGLANVFGFNGGTNEESSRLYQDILLSKKFLMKYVNYEFKTFDNSTVKLPELLGIKLTPDDPEYLYNAANGLSSYLLDGHLEINIKENSIVEISLLTPDPHVSANLLNMFVRDLDIFNRNISTKKAQENRIFIQQKMEESNEILKESEGELQQFREKNRAIMLSPELQLKEERLIRNTKINLEMFITFKKEFELAKIQENKETATISLLDSAQVSFSHKAPKVIKVLVISIFGGLITAILISFGLNYLIQIYPNIRKNL